MQGFFKTAAQKQIQHMLNRSPMNRNTTSVEFLKTSQILNGKIAQFISLQMAESLTLPFPGIPVAIIVNHRAGRKLNGFLVFGMGWIQSPMESPPTLQFYDLMVQSPADAGNQHIRWVTIEPLLKSVPWRRSQHLPKWSVLLLNSSCQSKMLFRGVTWNPIFA